MRNLKPYLTGYWKGIKDENDLFHDFSGQGNNGTITGATQVDGRDGQAIKCVSGSSQYVSFGDIGIVRSISFWIILDTGTEKILQLSSSVSIEAAGGSINLTGFTSGNVYVDGIDTNSIGSDAWHHISVVDTSDITADAFEVGRVDTPTYGDITIGEIRAFSVSLSANEAEFLAFRPSRSESLVPVGKMRRYFEFDGADDYLSHADDDALDMGVSDGMLEAWIWATSEAKQPIIYKGGAGGYYDFHVNLTTGFLECEINDGTNTATITGDVAVNDGQWHHVVCSLEKSSVTGGRFYVDGVEDESAQTDLTSVGDIDNDGVFYIGYDGTDYFVGRINLANTWNEGYGGLPSASGATPADYAAWRWEHPDDDITKFASGAWSGYADALRTAAGELVTDGGIENWTGDTPDDWNESGESAGVRDITDGGAENHSGSHSAKLKSTADDGTGLFWIDQHSITLTPGLYYEVSCWVYYKVQDTGYLRFSMWNLTDGDMWSEGITSANGEWTRYSKIFTPTVANNNGIYLYMQNETDAEAYLDDISLKRVGNCLKCDLDGTQSFRADDETSNALHLTQADPTKQPSIVHDLEIKMDTDPLFYEPLNRAKLSDKWTVVSGSFEPIYDSTKLVTGIKCLTAGVIGIPVPEQLYDLSKQRVEWTWKMYKDLDVSITDMIFISDAMSASPNGYQLSFTAAEAVELYDLADSVSLGIKASAITIQTWYDCKVTRDAAGEFTFYLDDVEVVETGGSNPVTDTTTTNTKYIVLDLDAGDMIANIKVRRY